MHAFKPAYLKLLQNGLLEKRAELAHEHLKDCDLCARYCHVNRMIPKKTGKKPFCNTWENAVVDSYGPHFGEERPLRGYNGSGTIFFSWCNLRCVYCQNWTISQLGEGVETRPEALADVMLSLQAEGCHNINLVSPSHVVAQSIRAIYIAAKKGLEIPIVYNTGGYDSPEALALLDGIIDIYMPDMKYSDEGCGRKYSKALNYPEVNMAAVKEMHRQTGDLVLDENGIALRGLLVRHLILPGGLSGTERILSFISREISKNTYLNIMDQYRPCFKAGKYPEIDKSITREEFSQAIQMAKEYGLKRLDKDISFF